MNKLNIILLLTIAGLVGTNIALARRYGGGNGPRDWWHKHWEIKKQEWTDAINKADEKTKANAQYLMEQLEKIHKNMVDEFNKVDKTKIEELEKSIKAEFEKMNRDHIKALRREKHELMRKLDEMLGLPSRRERIKAKYHEVKEKIHQKVGKMKSKLSSKGKVQQRTEKEMKKTAEELKTATAS